MMLATSYCAAILLKNRQFSRRRGTTCWLAAAVFLLTGLAPVPGQAITWIEQVERSMTCTSFATPDVEAQLKAPFIPDVRNPRAVQNYFQGPAPDLRQARFRHLTMLAATAWWADLVNDQRLRGDAYLAVQQLAARYATENAKDRLFRQIARCAQVQVMSVMLEIGEIAAADQLAKALVQDYASAGLVYTAEDWPLILALREAVLEPRAKAGIEALTQAAWAIASTEPMATQFKLRTSRLMAAAARGSLAIGKADDARNLAAQSMFITGQPAAPEAAWRAFPVLYDVFVDREGPDKAAALISLLGNPAAVPAALNDRAAAFEALERATVAAEATGDDKLSAALKLLASRQLTDWRTPQPLSQAFYRHGWSRLAAQRWSEWKVMARHDPAFASKQAQTYIGTADTLIAQAQDQFVANTAELLFYQYKIDNSLHALTAMYPALPRMQPRIEDTTFRMAQLRSFGRITLATVAAELGDARLDPKNRFHVERFFSLSTQTGTWIRGLLNTVLAVDPAKTPRPKALWDAFFMLDVFYQETAKEYSAYAAYVRQQVPSIAELVTPKPRSITNYQQLLKPDEALIATLVTPRDLYVWSLTVRGVSLSRKSISDREVGALVTRLRAGLTPASSGGRTTLPDFDAAAAHELYQLIFEPVAASLKDVKHVIWYGHGPLGSVPPAVLVAKKPPNAVLSTPKEFGQTQFLVDRFAFSALADLSLFPVHRKATARPAHARAFLGVGAPMLDAAEVSAGPRSKSYDLAGAMDGKALSELPVLAESVDEINGLAAALGTGSSTIWLGPDADEKRFRDDALRGYQVVALATHGFMAYEVQNIPEPSLMLALVPDAKDRFDGLLTTREIVDLQLDADLVVLSACNTAAADGRPRSETFTGLTQAFFTAGARTLMASHWPVMSGAAVQLSVATIDASRKQNQPLAISLQRAMQTARRDGAASPIESHPSYWGPFVVVGDGNRALAR
ncbi:MAG: CHAT domain-containing protein [Gammaproteobacteria bacterium]